MRIMKSTAVEEAQIVDQFESLRRILTADRYAGHLEKPLAYWAMPNDRRLPLALLGRKLDELLNTPFTEISSTPGIGRRKITSLMTLLSRAAETDPTELSAPESVDASETSHPTSRNGNGYGKAHKNGNGHAHVKVETGFDPASVSEITWSQWRACVVRHGLEAEMLGRFAPSLRDITRVIWYTPLGKYTHCTLAEMRSLKTHGEKRICAILEVFHCVNEMVGQMGNMPHLSLRIVPRQIDRVEQWIARVRQTAGIPSEQELFDCFVEPLLEQVRADAPQQLVALAENRLGLAGPITSVRQAARGLGLTRARVYQLLNEINDIMAVRWPNGRHQVYELREKLETEAVRSNDTPDLERFLAACELFYPASRRGADGAVDPSEDRDTLSPGLTTLKPR